MTVLTDIPLSGLYFQQGAVTQLIVKIVDLNTGQPVQLQQATGLKIAIQYPDLTFQQFTAALYTDGSDGKIVYTTVNSGPNAVDLSEVGLYHIQGQAVIGATTLLPSPKSDFYVLPNIGPAVGPTVYPGFALYDSTNVRWFCNVIPKGNTNTTPLTTGPAGTYDVQPIIMRDAGGNFWQLGIDTTGHIIKTGISAPTSFITSLLIQDSTGYVWQLTILPTGDLYTV